MAEFQLQGCSGLIAHSGSIGLVLSGVRLAIVDGAVHTAVPSTGAVDTESVALPDAGVVAGVHQFVLLSGLGIIVDGQSDGLAVDTHIGDLDFTEVWIQSAPVL